MITKGIIEEVVSPFKARVRLPVYHGIRSSDYATETKDLPIATLCALPNCAYAMNVGDVVYCGVEDNDFSKPVILGFLYKQDKAKTSVDLSVNSINVVTDANFPDDTKIGSISPQSIQNLSGVKRNVQNQIDDVENDAAQKYKSLNDLVSGIKNLCVDKTSDQVIGGQKDFKVVPRVLVSSKLPDGYTQLEYIIFNGTQGIDTKLTGTLTTAIKIQYYITDTEPGRFDIVIGSRAGATSSNITIAQGFGNSNNAVIDFGNYNNTRLTTTEPSNTWLEAYTDKNYRYILNLLNGNSSAVATSYNTSFTTPYNLFIGYMGDNYITTSHKNLIGRIKMCQIWENNVLVRDFIPCKNSENTVGMYDAVNDVFYPDMNEGTFEAGPETSGLHYAKIVNSDDVVPVTYDVFMEFLKMISNYDGSVSQTLKHSNDGSIQWVND